LSGKDERTRRHWRGDRLVRRGIEPRSLAEVQRDRALRVAGLTVIP
jgi:hypothetical protein